MIKVGNYKIDVDSQFIDKINKRITDSTVRTNLNPNFLLRKNYSGGHIDEVFVGHWDSEGLWIAYYKFILPTIIAKVKTTDNNNIRTYGFTYYIGLSSIMLGTPFIIILTAGFLKIGFLAFILALIIALGFYSLLVLDAKEEIERKINTRIFEGLRKKSQPTTTAHTP